MTNLKTPKKAWFLATKFAWQTWKPPKKHVFQPTKFFPESYPKTKKTILENSLKIVEWNFELSKWYGYGSRASGTKDVMFSDFHTYYTDPQADLCFSFPVFPMWLKCMLMPFCDNHLLLCGGKIVFFGFFRHLMDPDQKVVQAKVVALNEFYNFFVITNLISLLSTVLHFAMSKNCHKKCIFWVFSSLRNRYHKVFWHKVAPLSKAYKLFNITNFVSLLSIAVHSCENCVFRVFQTFNGSWSKSCPSKSCSP